MPSRIRAGSVSKGRLWSGRIISGLMVLFLLFDGITKLMRVAPVLEASAQLGYPVSTLVGIGIGGPWLLPAVVVDVALLLGCLRGLYRQARQPANRPIESGAEP